MTVFGAFAGFVLTTVEAIGDITATEEASALTTFGNKHNKRVQGGLLGDGQYTFVTPTTPTLPAGFGVLYTPSCGVYRVITAASHASA